MVFYSIALFTYRRRRLALLAGASWIVEQADELDHAGARRIRIATGIV
jgi:hypothetical protein